MNATLWSSIQMHLPALQVIVPLFGALICALLRGGRMAWAWALIVNICAAVIAVLLLQKVLQTGAISYAMGGWKSPIGIEYRVDLLSAYILLLVAMAGSITMIYARSSVANEIDGDKQSWFYTMYLLCLTGLLGIAITGDAFNAFVFLEVSSLATYTLIALGKNRRALLAAYQYLILGTIGATFYIIGVGLLYVSTGTLNFVDLAERLSNIGQTRPVLAALAFLTVGISLKLALFPLHAWLPNAYACAPSVATSFLAGTATKVAVYLLLRIFFTVYGVSAIFSDLAVAEVLLAASLAAMIIASIVALYQDDAKRLLAYSSVAQIGYITLGIALANQSGLTGALVHIFNHAMIKTTLFLAIGAVILRLGSCRLEDMAGIGKRMPVTMTAFTVAGLGLIGVPGTAGFVSKYHLAVGAVEKGWWGLVFAIVASSFIAILYVGRMAEIIWFREPSASAAAVRDKLRDPPPGMLVSIVFLMMCVIWFGFDTRLTVGIAGQAAQMLLGVAR